MSDTRIVVLISGSGTNLQALMDAQREGRLGGTIVAVISNRPLAGGLQRAERAEIATRVVDHTDFTDRETFDRALMEAIDHYQPELLVLAGFMRILTPQFVAHYQGRMMNIHPSLLPKYPGLHTHRRAMAAGDSHHGATVHFVTDQLDGGPPIVQARIPIQPDDDEASLSRRVQEQEHRIYPLAVQWFATGRLYLKGSRCSLDGELLPAQGHLIDVS